MSDTKIYGEKHLPGVGCDVTTCKFNGTRCGAGMTCCAEHINVRNESALRKAETFCGTFEPGTSL